MAPFFLQPLYLSISTCMYFFRRRSYQKCINKTHTDTNSLYSLIRVQYSFFCCFFMHDTKWYRRQKTRTHIIIVCTVNLFHEHLWAVKRPYRAFWYIFCDVIMAEIYKIIVKSCVWTSFPEIMSDLYNVHSALTDLPIGRDWILKTQKQHKKMYL